MWPSKSPSFDISSTLWHASISIFGPEAGGGACTLVLARKCSANYQKTRIALYRLLIWPHYFTLSKVVLHGHVTQWPPQPTRGGGDLDGKWFPWSARKPQYFFELFLNGLMKILIFLAINRSNLSDSWPKRSTLSGMQSDLSNIQEIKMSAIFTGPIENEYKIQFTLFRHVRKVTWQVGTAEASWHFFFGTEAGGGACTQVLAWACLDGWRFPVYYYQWF